MSDKHENILHELADQLLDYFEGTEAVNYIEHTFECREDSSKSFVVTMQRVEGLTPCEKLAEANREIEKLKSENSELFRLKEIFKARNHKAIDYLYEESCDSAYNALCALEGN